MTQHAKNWIRNRLGEPSTFAGIGMILCAAVKVFAPQYAILADAILAAGGTMAATRKSPGSPDNPPGK